jgi:hypothetical protein
VRKINLKAKNISAEKNKQQGLSGNASVAVGFFMLILAGLLYGAVYYLNGSQAKKIKTVKGEIVAIKRSLDTNKDFKEVYDFQGRLLDVDKILENKVVEIDILNKLSETTLGEVKLTGLKAAMNGGNSDLSIALNASDLDMLSKQLESYNVINSKSQAKLKNSTLKDDMLEADIELTIPKNKEAVKSRE